MFKPVIFNLKYQNIDAFRVSAGETVDHRLGVAGDIIAWVWTSQS